MKVKEIKHEFGKIIFFGDMTKPNYVGFAKIMYASDTALLGVLDDDDIEEFFKDPNNYSWPSPYEDDIDFNFKTKTFKSKDFYQESLGNKYTAYDLKLRIIIANMLVSHLENEPLPNFITLDENFQKCKLNNKIIDVLSLSYNDVSIKNNISNKVYNISLDSNNPEKNKNWFNFDIIGEGFNAKVDYVPYKGYIIFHTKMGRKENLSINDAWERIVFFQAMTLIMKNSIISLNLQGYEQKEVEDYFYPELFAEKEVS